MAFTIKLEQTNGKPLAEITDEGARLEDLLPPRDDRSFVCLRFIDQYADTIFNGLQMEDFLAELERIRPKAQSEAQVRLLDELRALARRCKEERRLLRFYGD